MIRRARLGLGLAAGLGALGGPAAALEAREAGVAAPAAAATAAAPEVAPAPRGRPAAAAEEAGERRARELAREAARAYSLALASPADEQAAKFAAALALFDRILAEHPGSSVARDAQDGAIGMIDVGALRAFVAATAPPAPAEPEGSPAVAGPGPFAAAADRAASVACAGSGAGCADALAAAARAWVATADADAALSALRSAESGAARLAAFEALLAAEAFAAFEAATARAAPVAALVALDALGSARAPAPPGLAAGDGAEGARRAARLWSVSAVSLALLADDLVAGGVAEAEAAALVERAAAFNARLYASLAAVGTFEPREGAEGPRPLSAAERRFLDDLFALTVDTQVALLGAAGHVAAAERADALAQWLDETSLAVSPWRMAVTSAAVADDAASR